jgi:transglutaminase-like putative cysteine protease
MRGVIVRLVALSLLIAAALIGSSLARADDLKKDFAGYTKYLYCHVRYDVNPDGTHVETNSWALKVLTEQGVSEAQEASVSVSERLQTMEILTAHTLKKDGTRIKVPATNFQDETNTGKGTAAPMFSDMRTRTIAFPDVAVGDTVVLSYKLTEKEATFPGNFSMLQTFSKFGVYDDVQVSLSAPASLALRVFSRGVDGGEAPSSNGRRNWAWSYKNLQITWPEAGAVSTVDYGPLIVATTFKDYGALAEAYNARAKTKATPTDRIRKLANDLTQNAHTPRDQAKALYDWVAQNIKFAGNCVGAGSVVPHDADVVLANRMGDCKDHTTLLQSLLAVSEPDATVDFSEERGHGQSAQGGQSAGDAQGRRGQGQVPDLQGHLSEAGHRNCRPGSRGSHAGAGLRACRGCRLQAILDRRQEGPPRPASVPVTGSVAMNPPPATLEPAGRIKYPD